jgi:hypothetical protein
MQAKESLLFFQFILGIEYGLHVVEQELALTPRRKSGPHCG